MNTEKSASVPEERTITVGELLDRFSGVAPETIISFSGLDFYRTKWRGDDLIQIEFNQAVYRDRETGRVHINNLMDDDDDEIDDTPPLLMLVVKDYVSGEIIADLRSSCVPAAGTYILVSGATSERSVYKVERTLLAGMFNGNLLDYITLYVRKSAWTPPDLHGRLSG